MKACLPTMLRIQNPQRQVDLHGHSQGMTWSVWLGGGWGEPREDIAPTYKGWGNFKPQSADKAWKIGSITVRLQCEDAEANLVAWQMSHSLHTQARHYQGVVGPIHVSLSSMGIFHLPILDDFWKRDPLLHYAPNADRISCDRFRELSHRTYSYFVDKCHTCDQGVTRVRSSRQGTPHH